MLTDHIQGDYQFTDGDLSLIEELGQPKQEMNIEERPDFEPPVTEQESPNQPEDNLVNAAIEETASIVTDTIDFGAAFGLHLISKNPIEQHKATDEQKLRIRQIVYVYCEQTGGYIPLWLQLVILLVGIYASQIPAALDARKINILEEKNRKLKEEIRKMQLEKQAVKLQNELNEPDNDENNTDNQ